MYRLASPVRKNDTVVVTTGRDRGKRGRVLRVLPNKGRLIVEGVNFVKRHTRANPQRNIKGGIVEREASLHASNVQIVCPECGAVTRVTNRRNDDGTRTRTCRKCHGVLDK
jgi:large subunit ribosomal protein L24